ncbi:hypothetical protein B0T24DRAFT_596008 [Lasiosphaeria ovina]|uniref:C2H2-type domain-containing protein n=1 Tax=Lasiosphaeria ovina TaxID=92902 RepID=A0AAE0K363_9PEZI|nr:hypothetical protein B0T24DRAFT_596008 [Lasiosphaeria ovina]
MAAFLFPVSDDFAFDANNITTSFGLDPNSLSWPLMSNLDPATPHLVLEALPQHGNSFPPGIPEHGNIWPFTHQCADATCFADFPTRKSLHEHANQTGHLPFGCWCGKLFKRADTLNRHITPPSIECEFCTNHDGDKAFRRLDHLRQHLSVFHRFNKKAIDSHCKARAEKKARA